MAGMTTQEELTLVDSAISTILGGGVAEFKEGAHGARMLPLKDLYSRRDELRNQLVMETDGILLPVREVNRESSY